MTLSLEEAIARVPAWTGLRSLETLELHGGITNRNIRIRVNGESFVLRICGDNTELLGINRTHEYRAHLAAAACGIAPEIIYALPVEGILVTRFIDGQPIPKSAMQQPQYIRRVTEAFRKIHAINEIPGSFSPFRTVENYANLAQINGSPTPDDFNSFLTIMKRIEATILQNPTEPRPCHNDLLNQNFLDDGNIRILDWEYAGMGDPCFDLANFAANHELDEKSARFLLECYLGSATESSFAKLHLMGIISELREATWGVVQSGISHLDFDFPAYAGEHFERVREILANSNLGDWLEKVGDSA